MALLSRSAHERGKVWGRLFAAAGEDFIPSEHAVADPDVVTHIACWMPPTDLERYRNLRAVICVGAGVDHIKKLPEGVSLVRTLAPGIEKMVCDWVIMATLSLHRDLPFYLEQAQRREWQGYPACLNRSRRVGVMGMGRIGKLVAGSLARLDFDVAGFSRSGTTIEGITVYGQKDLDHFLNRTDLLICLLPLTDSTRGILNAELFCRLRHGARLVHAGRGAQLDMEALRQALDSGQIMSAMLDVTEPEPLPTDHWAWNDPRVLVTPHIAAHTDAEEGAHFALSVIHADREGLPLPGLVDPAQGY